MLVTRLSAARTCLSSGRACGRRESGDVRACRAGRAHVLPIAKGSPSARVCMPLSACTRVLPGDQVHR